MFFKILKLFALACGITCTLIIGHDLFLIATGAAVQICWQAPYGEAPFEVIVLSIGALGLIVLFIQECLN